MLARYPFERFVRRAGFISVFGAAALLLIFIAGPSRGEDRCDDACLKAQLAKIDANDPAAAEKHAQAMSAYLRTVHAGVPGAPGETAADALPTPKDVAPADDGLLHDVRDFLQTAPAKAASPVRVAQIDPPAYPDDGRSYVGEKLCMACHRQAATNWAHTIHAKVFELNPQNALQGRSCEACHGPGSAHVKNPKDLTTIISFSNRSQTPVPQQNSQCLACHKGGARIYWHASIHESNNLACSDCHNPMANFSARGLTARESVNQTCFSCHKEQRAQFSRRSHMPLLEGKLSCVDCHNPHGSATAPLLKADSVNEVCYGCHADKRGPFLFEHAPVRENCLNCHNPHGSNYEALLTTARPLLCQQCHAQSGHPAELMTQGNMALGPVPDPRLIGSSCQTCHSEIHGSNSPAGARFER